MRKYSIGSRYIALFLLVAMMFTMLPVMELAVNAATYELAEPKFLPDTEDRVNILDNGESITLPIKVNNFMSDGMLFEYLSSSHRARDFNYYLYESPHAGYQIYPVIFDPNRVLGYDKSGVKVTDTINSDVPVGDDPDGFIGINPYGSLTWDADYDDPDRYGYAHDGNEKTTTLDANIYTDGGGTKYLHLWPTGTYTGSGNRAWRTLTQFNKTQTVKNARYAVLIYRMGSNNVSGALTKDNTISDTKYAGDVNKPNWNNMLLTVDYMTEGGGSTGYPENRCNAVYADMSNSGNWTYAIFDLGSRMSLDKEFTNVYLRTPLHYGDTGCYFDVAAIAYFPYYGDAEQFAYYGLTLGTAQRYFGSDNASFNFRGDTTTCKPGASNVYSTSEDYLGEYHKDTEAVAGLPTWLSTRGGVGGRPFTFAYSQVVLGESTTISKDGALQETVDTIDQIGYMLYGDMDGHATIGLMESSLDENGMPVYKAGVVRYLAVYLRNRLCSIEEYPSDNEGWRNYTFITGVSTSGATNEARFGTDSLGRPIDLATAICNQLHVTKGSGEAYQYEYQGYASDDANVLKVFGNYADTIAKKDQLTGTWKNCKNNITTWYDAAYFLLHNLFVSQDDSSWDVDGYGEYEDTYQYMVLPQAELTDTKGNVTTAYFFDSGYALDNGSSDVADWESAVKFKAPYIYLDTAANGKAQFCDDADKQTFSNLYPFLVSSGNNAAGESNSPYYLHDGVVSRGNYGWTYHNRDYHYTISGNGYFAYEKDLYFRFDGDDDVYLFINGELLLDIGGTHGATYAEFYLDDYVDWAWSVKNGIATYKGKSYAQLTGADKVRVDKLAMTEGGVYSFDFFYMERHGVGSNLKITTNMEVTAEGLDVDKFAYQNDRVLPDNAMFNAELPVEYGFAITNNSDNKLYDLSFSDPVIGVHLNYLSGLTVADNSLVKDKNGEALDVTDLEITVTGLDASNQEIPPITVTCNSNAELIAFLKNLETDDGTQTDDVQDFTSFRTGSGLWQQATITVRGIYYTLTAEQQQYTSFRNYVTASGDAGDHILRGSDNHTLHQPGPSYYQWAGHPVVVENERLYRDLIEGGVVASAADLPALGHMVMVPSTADGNSFAEGYLSGGDVQLTLSYPDAGTELAYVTILDETDPDYKLTVPLTIYVMDVQDSVFVLDYGLDTYLTDADALFAYERGQILSGSMDAAVMGIAGGDKIYVDGNQQLVGAGYVNYDTGAIRTADGNTDNGMTVIQGSYDAAAKKYTGTVMELDSAFYLDHEKPWVVEWNSNGWHKGGMLFSGTQNANVVGNTYLYFDCNTESNGNNDKFMGLGYADTNGYFQNYGVVISDIANVNKNHTYRLFNVPAANGKNTVYFSLDGGTAQPMTRYNYNGTMQDTESNGIAGLDFTFKYIGATSHTLNATNLTGLKIYEDGIGQLTNYHWELDGSTLKSVDSGKSGYVANTPTLNGSVGSDGASTAANTYWTLEKEVVLSPDERWSMSFTASGITGGTMLASYGTGSNDRDTYIYLAPSTNYMMVCMGYRNKDTGVNAHVNYAADVKDIIGDFTGEHTYTFENRVALNGANMVYLSVDGTEVGPLDTKVHGGSSIQAENTWEISGRTFVFQTIGSSGYGLDSGAKLKSFSIQTRPELTTSYAWVNDNVRGTGSFVNATADGNRITFDKDTDGVVEAEDGIFTLSGDRLKFEVTDFMNGRYSMYIAMTLHEQGFNPTPLHLSGVDVGKEVQMYKQLTVLPANVVYYEDDFPAIHYVGTQVNSFTTVTDSTEYIVSGNGSGDLTQSSDQDTPYGSDDTYADTSLSFSGDSLHTIAINNDGPLAWFEFTGRGFEISARTNATDSGMMVVRVYKKSAFTLDSNGELVLDADGLPSGYLNATATEIIPVISEYDNGSTIGGGFNRDDNGTETLYQVPLIRYYSSTVQPQDYVVVISGLELLDYGNDMEHIDTYLYLDGIRIYRPICNEGSGQINDIPEYGDQNMANFEELRDLIVDGKVFACSYSQTLGVTVSSGTVTWTEKFNNTDYEKNTYTGVTVGSVNDYLMDGPNNEVYMDGTFTNGAIGFYVRIASGGTYKDYTKNLQIGVRALDLGLYSGAASTGRKANLWLGVEDAEGNPAWTFLATVTGATEQYYEIPFHLCPTDTVTDREYDSDGNLTGTTSNTYHRVVIKVDSADPAIPAMVSFTGIKRTSGLVMSTAQFETKSIKQNENGEWVIEGGTDEGQIIQEIGESLSSNNVLALNEVPPVGSFDTPIPGSITAKNPSLSFEDEVKYNIYYTTEGLDNVTEMGLITFDEKIPDGTVEDANGIFPGYAFSAEHEMYVVRSGGIAAKDLGKTLYFRIYAKLADGSYVYSQLHYYSAKTYAYNVLAGDHSPELKALVVAMLNYGALAQEYFGENEPYMNSELTPEQLALVDSYSPDMVSPVIYADKSKAGSFAATAEGFTKYTPSVTMAGAFAINYYFQPDRTVDDGMRFYYWTQEDYESADTLTAENATGAMLLSGSTYKATVEGIAAKEMGNTVYVAAAYESEGVSYCTGVLAYSIGAYCKNFAGRDTSSMQDLAAAMAVYGYYAEKFFS